MATFSQQLTCNLTAMRFNKSIQRMTVINSILITADASQT